MPKLSIIIVNYRTPYFVEQCLRSVGRAAMELEGEVSVWVVDNASRDGSLAYLEPRYPWVNFIALDENIGYGRANNEAYQRGAGEAQYILLLNPDTLIAEDSLRLAIDWMESHPRAGAIGLEMYDATGQFLKESKRSLPTLWNSFCRFSGLSSLFPKSKLFASYTLGNLLREEAQSVEILCGAFMLLRREALSGALPFDERFFMYGEDVDLSYRIKLNGWQCYYLPIPMLHYKGESSSRDMPGYIKHFYEATYLFYEKYHAKSVFSGLVYLASRLLAKLSLLRYRLSVLVNSKEKGRREPPKEFTLSLNTCYEDRAILLDAEAHSYKDLLSFLKRHEGRGIELYLYYPSWGYAIARAGTIIKR